MTFFFLLPAKWRFFPLRHCRRRRYSTLSRKRLYMLLGEEEEEEEVAESHSGLGYMTEGEKASTAKVESACDDVKNFSPYWVFSLLLLLAHKVEKGTRE